MLLHRASAVSRQSARGTKKIWKTARFEKLAELQQPEKFVQLTVAKLRCVPNSASEEGPRWLSKRMASLLWASTSSRESLIDSLLSSHDLERSSHRGGCGAKNFENMGARRTRAQFKGRTSGTSTAPANLASADELDAAVPDTWPR